MDLEYLISKAIDKSFQSASIQQGEYLKDFAELLVRKAAHRAHKAAGATLAEDARKYDPLSVISLNWDMALDTALYRELPTQDGVRVRDDYGPIGVVDYCCYISSYEQNDWRVRPGLWALGARGFNVKLLKLHGSMNWLQCLSCQRLFVSFDKKVILSQSASSRRCRHCQECGVRGQLQGALVMPTFLKDLSNFQIKLVWQNAGVELMEATKLVFIGYSLPFADFEFRQLLSRKVRRDAQVHVILYNRGGEDGDRAYAEECKRYKQFFAGRDVSFDGRGVVAYVQDLIANPETGLG